MKIFSNLSSIYRQIFTSNRLIEWEYVGSHWPKNKQSRGWDQKSVAQVMKNNYKQFSQSFSTSKAFDYSNESISKSKRDIKFHNRVMSFAYVLALTMLKNKGKQISILDWGGGLGQYQNIAFNLYPQIKFNYTVFDTNNMVATGRKLNRACTFVDQEVLLKDKKFDLVFVSASLHYSPHWRSTLGLLHNYTKQYLFITRLPCVVNSKSFVMIQRPYNYGYETEYFGWCLNKQDFLKTINKFGSLMLRREFITDEKPIIKNAPEQCEYLGFLFEKS